MPTLFLDTGDCLKHLSKLSCCSSIHSEFFYQLSQICHNIQSLEILFENNISDGLTNLISAQKGLKHLDIYTYYYGKDLTPLSLFAKHSSTLIKLNVKIPETYVPLSFIAKFTNLQELELTSYNEDAFNDFNSSSCKFVNLAINRSEEH